MKGTKKFISPGAWFSMQYPANWNEFEDEQDVFLFYNPNEWTGNFRISAYRGDAVDYGARTVRWELSKNLSAQAVTIGKHPCAYVKEEIVEQSKCYTNHFWTVGIDDLVFECSFTTCSGLSTMEAEAIIASLEVRHPGVKYPVEVIPIRISEIYQIDEAYNWAEKNIKKMFNTDFQGSEADIKWLQKLADTLAPKKREPWIAIGIVLCVIYENETNGVEWCTLIGENREVPVLVNVETGQYIDPMKLIWRHIKAGELCQLTNIYNEMNV